VTANALSGSSSSGNGNGNGNVVSSAAEAHAEAYLERAGVEAYIKDALTLVLENRPEEPIGFLVEYFQNAVRGGTALSRAYRYVRLTKLDRPAFMDNLLAAFTTLDSRRHGDRPIALTGREFSKLLYLLSNEFPTDVVGGIMAIMNKADDDIIDFPIFAAGVRACLLFEEFFEQAEWLVKWCDSDSQGQIPATTVLQVIDIMKSDPSFRKLMPSDGKLTSIVHVLNLDSNSLSSTSDEEHSLNYREFIFAVFKVTGMAMPPSTVPGLPSGIGSRVSMVPGASEKDEADGGVRGNLSMPGTSTIERS